VGPFSFAAFGLRLGHGLRGEAMRAACFPPSKSKATGFAASIFRTVFLGGEFRRMLFNGVIQSGCESAHILLIRRVWIAILKTNARDVLQRESACRHLRAEHGVIGRFPRVDIGSARAHGSENVLLNRFVDFHEFFERLPGLISKVGFASSLSKSSVINPGCRASTNASKSCKSMDDMAPDSLRISTAHRSLAD